MVIKDKISDSAIKDQKNMAALGPGTSVVQHFLLKIKEDFFIKKNYFEMCIVFIR